MFYATIIALAVFAAKYLLNPITPFVIAFAVSAMISPVADKISADFKINKIFTACFATFVFYSITAGLVVLTGFGLYTALKNLFYNLPFIYENSIGPAISEFTLWLQQVLCGINPELCGIFSDFTAVFFENFGSIISDASVDAIGGLSSCVAKVPCFVASAFITVIATFFIVSDYHNICAFIVRQIPQTWHVFLKDVQNLTFKTLGKYSKSYLLITAITFCELTVALWLLGAKNFVAIALVIAVFDIIPVCGSGGILIPWAILSLIQNRFAFGAGMLIAYAIIAIVRQIIEPKIVGDQVGISPVVTLIAIFLGARFMGIFGLFAFPVTIVILKKLNDSGHIRLFK